VIAERSVVAGGAELRWVESGEGPGPPFLLLHGIGWCRDHWNDVLGPLGEHRRTIALDLPGFGRSSAPPGPYSPAWLAGGVRSFLDAIGVERAIVAGNSLGGLVGLHFAAAWPERTVALAALAPTLPNDGPPPSIKTTLVFTLGALPGVGVALMRAAWRRPPEAQVAESVARNMVDPSRLSAGTRALLEDHARRRGRSPDLQRANLLAQRHMLSAVTARRLQTWDVVRAVRVPAAFIWGKEDRAVPVGIGHRAVAELPGAHLIVLDDCGHNPQLEHPGELARALVSFARAAEAGGVS